MTDSPVSAEREFFATTRWSLVLRSKGGSEPARIALGELCAAYWNPVNAFIRQRRANDDEARDLTQEFFARLLAGRGVAGADPARGRFRSFLLGAVRHFLSDMSDHARAAKRGGGAVPDCLQCEEGGEGEEGAPIPDPGTPMSADDPRFDREWAVSVVNRALTALEKDQQTEGRSEAHAVLKPWLLGDVEGLTQAAAAERLGWTENAVRVAVHRLRRRFRDLVRAEIAQTVDGEAAVQEELRYLLEVLVGSP
jgi:RNA polymerase sigma-70 factor (ECF subfamily)